MPYVDGYVLPVPAKNIDAYRRMAKHAAKIWMDHGALEYRECVGEDLNTKFGIGFPKGLKIKRGETIVFAWIVFKSRRHRDAVNARVMKDPRLMPEGVQSMPFDHTRMLYGGFSVLVEAVKR